MSLIEILRLEGMSDREYKLRKEFYECTAQVVSNESVAGEDFDADNYMQVHNGFDYVIDMPYLPVGSGTQEWEDIAQFDREMHEYALIGLDSIKLDQ